MTLSKFTGDDGKRRIVQVLMSSPIIRGNVELAWALAEMADVKEYALGVNILTEGNDDNDIYFLLRGKAAILIDGIEVNRRTSERAEHIGDMSVIDPSVGRSATVLALEPTIAAKISETDFIAIADRYPQIWRELAVELARRNRQRNEHLKLTRQGPTISPYAPNWQQVVQLLERVPAGLRRWTWEEQFAGKREPRKWHVDNEYHVQNLLYAILAPQFPDIKEEDYSVSVGHKHPRLDLFLPSLDLAIEVKFLRPHVSFASIEGEIAEDATFYRSYNGGLNRKVIVFVWDDSARVNEHDLLKCGVKSMKGIDGIVVVSRPGNFALTGQTGSAP
jgi:CRP-like cAMP-binding protein